MGSDRLVALTEQLSTMFQQFSQALIVTSRKTADQESIKKYLQSEGKESRTEALSELERLSQDSLTPFVELLNVYHTNVLSTSRAGKTIKINLDSSLSVASHGPDYGTVGKLYQVLDSMYYPVVVAITEQKKPIGYIVRWRWLTATPKAIEDLSKLIGTNATLYFGNDDGKFWTDMMRPAKSPPIDLNNIKKIIEYSRTPSNPVIAATRPVANTNWLIMVEFSQKKVFEAANRFLYWIIISGAILVIIGIIAAWLMSRSITGPLKQLTRAASTIAGGNYSELVQLDRRDELGKLARAFNSMSKQVEKSQMELQKKARDYRLLFESNPMPMWIVSSATLDILDVNEAAVVHYGYTKDEFLKLNSRNLRPPEEVARYVRQMAHLAHDLSHSGIWRHIKKNGTLIQVEIISNDIIYKDEEARIILANDVTEKLKAEAELSRRRQKEQRLITETTIEAQEKEREEIGKELHDNINQILAAAKLQLEMAMTGHNGAQPLKKSSENINLAIKEIRQLSQSLVAPSLGDVPLSHAIRDLIDNISMASSLKLELDVRNYDEDSIDDNIKLMLYRIVQEQLNNILKHSFAKKALIELNTSSDDIMLSVKDDGRGFDTSKSSGGIGLRNMTNRASLYNGTTRIISSPGKGCYLEVTVPLAQEEKN